MAMPEEAEAVIRKLNLKKQSEEELDAKTPLASSFIQLWSSQAADETECKIHLILPATDKLYEISSVSTEPAALATLMGIQMLHPDLVVSVGTGGGVRKLLSVDSVAAVDM